MKYLENIYRISPKLKIDGKNTGSSVILNEDGTRYVLTAKHCLKNLNSKISLDFYNTSNGEFESYDLVDGDYKIIPTDESSDMAILKIKSEVQMPGIPSIKLADDVFNKNKDFFLQGFFTGNEFQKPEKIKVYYTDLDESGFRVGTTEKLEDEVSSAQENVEGFSGSGCFFEINQEIYLIGITKKFVSKIQRFIILDLEQVRKNISPIQIYDESQIPFDSPNIELIRDFKRQLSEAEEYVCHFKPITAQIEVERIQKSIELSSIPSKDKDSLLAECSFIKGIALISLEKNGNESNELLIKAYNLVPDVIKYKERAASVFYIIDKQDARIPILIDEVLSKDPYNPRVWALKNALSNTDEVIPELVLAKPRYRYNTFILRNGGNRKLRIKNLDFDFEHILENEILVNSEDIIYDSFQYYMFLGIYFLNSENGNIRILAKDKNKEIPSVTSKAKKGAEILRIIIEKLSDSEIKNTNDYKQINFFFEYSKYKIQPTKRQAQRLYDLFIDDEFTSKVLFKAFDIAFALLDYDLHNEVVEVIESSGAEEIDIHFRLIRAGSLQAIGKTEDAKVLLKKYLKEIDELDSRSLRNTTEAITTLQSLGEDSNDIFHIIQGKTFNRPYYKDLLDAYTLRLIQDKRDECSEIADRLVKVYWEELEFNEKVMVIAILGAIGDLKKAIVLFKPILNTDKEHHFLENYIEMLWICKGDNSELLQLLKKWRLNFSANSNFLRYEIELNIRLDNYLQIEEICIYGLEKFPQNERFKYLLIYVLFRQNKLLDITKYLDDSLLNLDLSTEEMLNLSKICISSDNIELGLEIAYSQLIKYPDNIDIQMCYLNIFISSESTVSILNPKNVGLDTVVELEIDGISELYDVTHDSINSNPIIQKVFNQKLYGELQIKTIYQDNIVVIKAIYNKYLGEVKKIFLKVSKPLAGGLPLKLIKFGDNDSLKLESFEKKLKQDYGQQGLLRKIELDKVIEKYQKREIGFFELCQSLFNGNPFDCFESITKDFNLGITIVPLIAQKSFQLTEETELVLDFSTILLFFNLSDEIDFKGYKFYISQSLKDILNNYIRELKGNQKEKMALSILPDKVVPIFYPDNYVQEKLERMTKLLAWVEDSCIVDYIDNFLDDENILNEIPNQIEKRYVFNTLMIANKPNRFLVTDDIFYYKNPIIPVITSEHLFKSIDSQLWEIAKEKMIQLNYKGLTLTKSTLCVIFEKSRIITKSNTFLFFNALKSLQGSYNPNKENVDEAIKFIKYIYSIPLDKNQRVAITKQVFIAILNEHYFDLTLQNLSMIYSKIDVSLNLLGEGPNIVKRCFKEVWTDLYGELS